MDSRHNVSWADRDFEEKAFNFPHNAHKTSEQRRSMDQPNGEQTNRSQGSNQGYERRVSEDQNDLSERRHKHFDRHHDKYSAPPDDGFRK